MSTIRAEVNYRCPVVVLNVNFLMKKRILVYAALMATVVGMRAQVAFKDADLFKINEIANAGKNADSGRLFAKSVKSYDGGKIDIIVRYSGSAALDEVEARGGEIISLVGTRTAIVRVAASDAVAVAASKGVTGAALSAKLKRVNDNALPMSNVDAVHSGTGIPRAFDGSDVVVGLFDIGVDPNHINFKDADGNNRIKTVFYYPGMVAVPEIMDTPGEISTFTADTRSDSHGTHVLGIMAGSFVDKSDPSAPDYRGVAPGSEIVVACGEGYNVQILDALERIGKYAADQGKPCVMNLSFGDNMGPHDGSDEFTEAINDIAEKYNAAIFLAVGNERTDKSYLVKTLSDDDPTLRTLVLKGSEIQSTTVQASSNVEIWTEDGTPFSVSLDIISRTKPDEVLYSLQIPEKRSCYVSQGDLIDDVIDTRRADLIKSGTKFHELYSSSFMGGVAGVDIYNKRYNAQLTMHLESRTSANANRYFVRINVTGQPGKTIFMYANNDYMNFGARYIPGLDEPDGNGSNSNMASGPNTIAVGSYVSNNYNTTLYEKGTVGDLSYFSSFGPTLYGRELPDICAPGQVIISSRNSDLSSSYYAYYPAVYSYRDPSTRKVYDWTICAGTSQATPHAAGIAALWLQANPDLSFADIRNMAQETAAPGGTATPGWGDGKIDALAGIKKAMGLSGISGVTAGDAGEIRIGADGKGSFDIFSAAGDALTVSVYSLQGAEVMRVEGDGAGMNVSTASLPAGIYVMQVKGANASKSLKISNY